MADLLTFQYRVDGVLTSSGVTSVTLGITRDSDDAVMLAPGTSTVNPSVGIYTYDPTALALSPSLIYTVTWTYVDGDGTHAVTDTLEASDSTRSLLAYRRKVQGELGRFRVLTTTAASASADATRELICGALVDSDGRSTQFGGRYAYLASGALLGEERRVGSTGYTASSGTLLVSRAYSGTPASGVTVELASALPATDFDDVEGVNSAINWALRRTWFRDRLSFTPVADQKFYSLLPYLHWLRDDFRLGHIYDDATDALGNPTIHRGGSWLRDDGELPMLEIAVPFPATATIFFQDVLRPGHTWIKQGGAWSESTTGLVSDSDEALVDPNLIVEMALVHCYGQLSKLAEPGERGQFEDRQKQQALKAAKLKSAMLQSFPDGAVGKSGRRNSPFPALTGLW